MPLIHCEINVIQTWSANCVITNFTGAGTFHNNWYKTLSSSCNFINSIQFKIATTIGQIFFNQPVTNNIRTYDSNWKIATGHGDYTGCLLGYTYSKKCYIIIAVRLYLFQKMLYNNSKFK